MRPLGRPPQKARLRWNNLRQTLAAKAQIEVRIAEGASLESTDFPSAWTEKLWADAIALAQDGLCAWCTVKPETGGHVGTVDHIRPRSEVTRDVGEPGNTVGPRARAEDRKLLPQPGLRPGYYWLAYEPDNLAFSCERCNTGWKRTLWPVKPWHEEASWRAPDPAVPEEELLLDPFAPGFHPLEHFHFGSGGAIIPRADDLRADATIAVLALDRQTLCEARAMMYEDLLGDVKSIKRAVQSATRDVDQVHMLRRIAKRCAWSTPHAAFYRVAMKHALRQDGLLWEQLRRLWDMHALAADVDEPPDDAWID